MKFCDHEDWLTYMRAEVSALPISRNDRRAIKAAIATYDSGYAWIRDQLSRSGGDSQSELDLANEREWWKHGRPYYNLWPSLLDMFLTFEVEKVPVSTVLSAKREPLCIRLPEGNASGIRAVLASTFESINGVACITTTTTNERYRNPISGRHEWANVTGMITFGRGCPDNATFQDAIDNPRALDCTIAMTGITNPGTTAMLAMHRIVITAMLLRDDPSIVEPDYLAADRHKLDSATEEEKRLLAEKAFRRRKQRGFDIGKQIEVMPHFRRPHPAIVWTGKGRTTAKVVMRKGSVVHRERAVAVPTGYLDEEDGESDGTSGKS